VRSDGGGVFPAGASLAGFGGVGGDFSDGVFAAYWGEGDLNRLKVDEVDFKATCFETGKKVDMGVVCSLCLSIFEKEPAGGVCLTCGASVDMEVEEYEDDDSDGDGERAKKQKCLS